MEDNWDDLLPLYEGFDIITRKYLDYCQFSGTKIQDYVQGLKDDEFGNYQNLSPQIT
jgi:hypothetical protein